MNLDLSAPIEINTFGFNIPSREFVISAQITRDKRMPLVDEFILRSLNIVEKISVARLARFFTFEGPELAIALADLQARSLVVLQGEEVTLHTSAKELFRTAADKEQPTIATVEEFHANVWFDLISHGLIARRGSHNARNLISLKPARTDLDIGADFARQAFDANFHDYLRRVRGIRNADQWSLYSILDVQPGRYSFAQWAGRELLKLGAVPKLEPMLVPEDESRTPRLQRLVAAMADELQHVGAPPASAAARDEYGRLVGSDSLKRALQRDGYVDVLQWLSSQNVGSTDPTSAILGYPYLQRNTRELVGAIARGVSRRLSGTVEIFWMRPGGTAWGITEDLNSFLREVRAVLRQQGAAEVLTTLLIPSSVPSRTALRSFERIFDRGIQLPANSLPAGLELFIIPQIAAVVTAGVSLSATVEIPVGTVTVERNLLKRVEERADVHGLAGIGTPLWPRERNRSSERKSQLDNEGGLES